MRLAACTEEASGGDDIVLQAHGVSYHSPGDEQAFFRWLQGIPFVRNVDGRLKTLYISIAPAAIDEDGVREIVALFRRYAVDLRQLAALERTAFTAEFAEWFRDARKSRPDDLFSDERPKPSERPEETPGDLAVDGTTAA